MKRLQSMKGIEREVIAFIMVPAWIKGPREALQKALAEGVEIASGQTTISGEKTVAGTEVIAEAIAPSDKETRPRAETAFSFTTHELVEPWNDAVTIQRQGFSYAPGSRVKITLRPLLPERR